VSTTSHPENLASLDADSSAYLGKTAGESARLGAVQPSFATRDGEDAEKPQVNGLGAPWLGDEVPNDLDQLEEWAALAERAAS